MFFPKARRWAKPLRCRACAGSATFGPVPENLGAYEQGSLPGRLEFISNCSFTHSPRLPVAPNAMATALVAIAAGAAVATNVLKDGSTVEQLRIGISRAQSSELAIDDTAMISNLANLYRSSISQLSPRIMVSGDPDYLNDNAIASTIRAALLGGLRSVVLWRQCGGTRVKLVLNRNQYLSQAQQLSSY